MLSAAWRKGKSEVFGEAWGETWPSGEDNTLANEIKGSKDILVAQHTLLDYRSKGAGIKAGFNYALDEEKSFGFAYKCQYVGSGKGRTPENVQRIFENGEQTAVVDETSEIDAGFSPVHDLNAYYAGKHGKLGIDFNATCLWKKQGRDMYVHESSAEVDSRDVHTSNWQHGNMVAGKLVLSYPVWKGTLSAGSEVTFSTMRGKYANKEQYVGASDNKISERNIAGFMEYNLSLGAWSFGAGARYEHVKSDYYSFGEWEKEPSRRYADWFPSASLSWNRNKWSVQLDYTCKTRRPSYRSLRNEVQYGNRYSYEGGNPYLRPCIIHNVDFTAVHSWLSVNAGYSYTDKPMIWNVSLYQGKDIAFFRSVNFRRCQEVYASVVASPRFGWYNPMLEIDYCQTFLNAGGYDITRPSSRPNFIFKLNNRFLITKTLKAFLDMKYRTVEYDGVQYNKPHGFVNVRVSKSLLKDALEISVFANDLFRMSRERWKMYGSNVLASKDCYGYYRKIGMSVSYNFNATKSRYKGMGAGNAEKGRL